MTELRQFAVCARSNQRGARIWSPTESSGRPRGPITARDSACTIKGRIFSVANCVCSTSAAPTFPKVMLACY